MQRLFFTEHAKQRICERFRHSYAIRLPSMYNPKIHTIIKEDDYNVSFIVPNIIQNKDIVYICSKVQNGLMVRTVYIVTNQIQ